MVSRNVTKIPGQAPKTAITIYKFRADPVGALPKGTAEDFERFFLYMDTDPNGTTADISNAVKSQTELDFRNSNSWSFTNEESRGGMNRLFTFPTLNTRLVLAISTRADGG
jgi:hypothetical protein